MGTAVAALAITAASMYAQHANTQRTEKKQDKALAQSIRNRSKEQQRADALVNENVNELAASTSADEAKGALDSYTGQLQRNRKVIEGGLTPTVGSAAFKTDASKTANAVNAGALADAGLLSRIEAPGLQRQGEAFSRGYLGTDLGLEQRASQGNAYLDDLNFRRIRRNPYIDMAAQAGMSYAGGMGGGMMGAGAAGAGAMPRATVNSYGAGLSSGAGQSPFLFRSPGVY